VKDLTFRARFHSFGKNYELVTALLKKAIEENALNIELEVITREYEDGFSAGFREGAKFRESLIFDEINTPNKPDKAEDV
jgi:ABC-type Na+ transport system ATPase subunit NatA